MTALVMAAVAAVGIALTVQTRFWAVRALPKACTGVLRPPAGHGGITPFQAVSTALAATMGTGNIAGVATALTAGGPGAVLWMWVFAFFGMTTKYAEIALAVKFRRKVGGEWRGGPMYYLRDALGSPLLAGIFALCCAAAAFGIGNAAQVNSVAGALLRFGVPAQTTGLCCAAVCGAVILGGVRRIGAVAEILVPGMSALYIAACVAALVMRRAALLPALELILREGLAPQAAAGGLAGTAVLRAMTVGAARGIFSNEAGLGSAPIAHASADCRSPHEQGLFGVFEVFADTLVMCTLTALVLLTAPEALWRGGLSGSALTAACFSACFGRGGDLLVALSMVCFGVSSLIGWAHYGETALAFLLPGRAARTLYRALYTAAAFFAAPAGLSAVWGLSDLLNAAMALPNIIGVALLSPQILCNFPKKR